MAEAYLTGRYMTCLSCYCWVCFHGVTDPGHKEVLISHGFKLWTETVIKGNRSEESSYFLDTYEIESDDSRVHFDHIIDLISSAPLLFSLLKELPVRIGLFWVSVSGSGGPIFSRKQQTFFGVNKITVRINVRHDPPPDTPTNAGIPTNPYDHECWCDFCVYGQEGATHFKNTPIPKSESLEGVKRMSHVEEDYGTIRIKGANAEEHAPICAKQLEELLLANVELVEFCKKQTETYDPLGRKQHGLDYGLVTCGNIRRVMLTPDFWRLSLELGCNVDFYFIMITGSSVPDKPQT